MKIALALFIKGELKAEGNSITEGVGQSRVTENLEGTPIDFAYQITDEEALPVLFRAASISWALCGLHETWGPAKLVTILDAA